jgi:hypothetical protein
MPSGTRSATLKYLLMVPLGKTDYGEAYQLVIGYFKCQSPSDMTKLKEEEFYEEFPFIKNLGDQPVTAKLSRGEVMELMDMQERTRTIPTRTFW